MPVKEIEPFEKLLRSLFFNASTENGKQLEKFKKPSDLWVHEDHHRRLAVGVTFPGGYYLQIYFEDEPFKTLKDIADYAVLENIKLSIHGTVLANIAKALDKHPGAYFNETHGVLSPWHGKPT